MNTVREKKAHQWCRLSLLFKISILLANQAPAADYSADKLSYKGIFDESIYDQGSISSYDDSTLRNLLRQKKQEKIADYFGRVISESEAFREELMNRRIDWKATAKEMSKGLLSGAVGWFSYRASVAVGETLDHVIPADSNGAQQKKTELESQIEDARQSKAKLEKGLDDEIIAVLENEYILKKRFIDSALQSEIESMLIRVRDEEVELSKKIDFIRYALDMPTEHKVLDTEKSIEAFLKNPYFQSFSESTHDKLLEIIFKICVDSQTPQTSKTKLRTTCYFHGHPGTGKSSSAVELAKTLGLPVCSLTINQPDQLSPDKVNGARGWESQLGWLTEALITKGADKKSYTNGILILNDFDRLLIPPFGAKPDTAAMNFLLEYLDTDLRKIRNNYFRTNIDVSRLNIIVTANTPLPFTLGLAMNPFGALISRIDTVHFEGFSEQDLKNFLTNIIDEMISKYDLVVEISLETYKSDLMNQAIVAQRQASGEEQIELRDLKKQLENLIMRKKLSTMHSRPSINSKPEILSDGPQNTDRSCVLF